jgi:uncharacterized membrane protein YjjP (DUF1212 family)
VKKRNWFVLGAVAVAAVLFAIAIGLNNGVAAITAFVLLAIALLIRYFAR